MPEQVNWSIQTLRVMYPAFSSGLCLAPWPQHERCTDNGLVRRYPPLRRRTDERQLTRREEYTKPLARRPSIPSNSKEAEERFAGIDHGHLLVCFYCSVYLCFMYDLVVRTYHYAPLMDRNSCSVVFDSTKSSKICVNCQNFPGYTDTLPFCVHFSSLLNDAKALDLASHILTPLFVGCDFLFTKISS